ncbi:MAG: alpha/beta hydrolase [Xanthomonadaceae bacterium]|nr:alpha/beta hydrolase [Xanthomonadaceae bacterium]
MNTPAFPDTAATLSLPGPAGTLEVAVDPPEADASPRPLVAVICHPLPTEGGTMHNKVVTMAARALRELGATTVRFNFRGTGGSEGTFDHGEGELDDLRTVVSWVRSGRPDAALWLGGFSFGSYVSLRGAAELKPDLLLSIAPPAGRWAFEQIETPTMPWLVIQGEEDEIVDPQAVYDWFAKVAPQRGEGAELVRMPETSHFFHRKLMDLRGAIKHGVQRYLPGGTSDHPA